MRAPPPLDSCEPFCRKPILAAPSKGSVGFQLTVWDGSKFPGEEAKELRGGLLPKGPCQASGGSHHHACLSTHSPSPALWVSAQTSASSESGFLSLSPVGFWVRSFFVRELLTFRKVGWLLKVRRLLSDRLYQIFTQQTLDTACCVSALPASKYLSNTYKMSVLWIW